MEEKKGCITINYGCCGNSDGGAAAPSIGENGNWFIGDQDTGIAAQGPKGQDADGNPVGTVIAFMGVKAPEHFLTCDGAVLNISDYKNLSSHIQDEFGSVNYFGGDGTTTFAIPDLRNEFLRGYHGEAEERLSDEIGKHQKATSMPSIILWNDSTGSISYPGSSISNESIYAVDTDTMSKPLSANRYTTMQKGAASVENLGISFTSRPINVAVLYCIKYE